MEKRDFALGWRQVAAGFTLLAITSFIATSYSVIAVPLGKEFHPDRMTLMMAMTVLSGASAIISPPLGWMMDRVRLRLLTTIGMVLLSAGYAALGQVHTFNQVFLVFGLLVAPANVLLGPLIVTVLLSRWFVRRRGAAIGIAIAGVGFGGAALPPLVALVIGWLGWRSAMLVVAAVLILILFPAILAIIERPQDRGLLPDGDPEPATLAIDPAPVPRPGYMSILASRNFWLVTLFAALVTSGLKGMATNLVSMADDAGVSLTAASFLLSLYSGSAMVGKLSFVGIADRLRPRFIAVISLAGFAAGGLIMALAGVSYGLMAASVIVIGVFGGLMLPLQSFLMPRLFGAQVTGKVGGIMNFLTMLALLTTPPLFGRVKDITGSYASVYFAICGLALLACLLTPLLKFGEGKDPGSADRNEPGALQPAT
ncbi:MAG: MFS transporter [Novosphingobium sp.]